MHYPASIGSILPEMFRLLLILVFGGFLATVSAAVPGTYTTDDDEVRIVVGSSGRITSVTISGGDGWLDVSHYFTGSDLKGNGTDDAWGSWENTNYAGAGYTTRSCSFNAMLMGDSEFSGSFTWSYEQKNGSTIQRGSGGNPDFTATLRLTFDFADPNARTISAAGGETVIGLEASGIDQSAVSLDVSAPQWMSVDAINWTNKSLRLTLAPNSGGERMGTIQIGYYGIVRTLRIYQSAPALPISVQHPAGTTLQDGAKIDFGIVPVSSQFTRTFTIRNTGDVAIKGLAVLKSGLGSPSDFKVSGIGATTLAPGAETSFNVTFNPSNPGVLTTYLKITSSDPNKDPFDLTLTGSGKAAPKIAIEGPDGKQLVSGRSRIDFGPVMINMGKYVTKTFTIRNIGSADLHGPSMNTNYAFPFHVSSSYTTLKPGDSATFSVTFHPNAGACSEVLEVGSNDSLSPFLIKLTGRGVSAPDIKLYNTNIEGVVTRNFVAGKSKLNFGKVKAGAFGKSHFMWIGNEGNTVLKNISVSIIGKNAKDFVLSPSYDGDTGRQIKLPKRLKRGEISSINVFFKPLKPGASRAILRITSNDKDENPFDIILRGRCTTASKASTAPQILANTYGPYSYTDNVVGITITDYNGAGGSLTIPSRIAGKPVTAIGDWAFNDCYQLTKVIIPPSVTFIGKNSFGFCTSLKRITIPDSVTYIGDGAFHDCSSLNSIRIPNNLATINYTAFSNCTGLTSLVIPAGVTRISWWAFSGCARLASITMPPNLAFVGEYAFYGCTSLRHVSFSGNAPQLERASSIFDGAPDGFMVRCLQGRRGFTTPVWNGYPCVAVAPTPEIAVEDPLGIVLMNGKGKRNFGSAKIGRAGVAKIFTIRNVGTGNVSITSVTRTGTQAKNFLVSKSFKKRLTPGTSTTVKVVFKPKRAGTHTATIRIRSNVADDNPFDLKVTGKGAR